MFFEPSKVFQCSDISKNKTKAKKLNVRRVLLNWKISKNRKYVNVYNKKLFLRNYFSKCSEVHLKIKFVISNMKVYLVKFLLLNVHEATSPLDLDKPQYHKFMTHIYFFSTKLLFSLSLKQLMEGSVKHGDVKFWFSGNAYTSKLDYNCNFI